MQINIEKFFMTANLFLPTPFLVCMNCQQLINKTISFVLMRREKKIFSFFTNLSQNLTQIYIDINILQNHEEISNIVRPIN
jgi:hypothetical protein